METEISKTQPEVTPLTLISQAIDKGADIEMLERLMALKERFDKKESEKLFSYAFKQWQENKPKIPKTKKVDYVNKTGGRTTYWFAPLPKIQELVDPVLATFGLSYSWKQEEKENRITITCILKHETGHYEESYLSAPLDTSGNKNAIQSIGSTVSYLKRYTLCNITGIASDEDDDGIRSELTKEEIYELQREKLSELCKTLDGSLPAEEKKRLDEILANNEEASYSKAIKILKLKLPKK